MSQLTSAYPRSEVDAFFMKSVNANDVKLVYRYAYIYIYVLFYDGIKRERNWVVDKIL